jgi:hypothetical protein
MAQATATDGSENNDGKGQKKYIVFSSSFLQHLPLLILLLLLDLHTGEGVADTDEGSDNDDGMG